MPPSRSIGISTGWEASHNPHHPQSSYPRRGVAWTMTAVRPATISSRYTSSTAAGTGVSAAQLRQPLDQATRGSSPIPPRPLSAWAYVDVLRGRGYQSHGEERRAADDDGRSPATVSAACNRRCPYGHGTRSDRTRLKSGAEIAAPRRGRRMTARPTRVVRRLSRQS
jgi:hypothetical protein